MSAAARGFIIFVGLVAFVAIFCVWVPFTFLPSIGAGVALPVISLPAEVLVGNILPGFDFTNTMTSLLLVDALLIAVAIVVGRAYRSASPDRFVPRGLTNFVELIGEFLYNQAYNLLGKRTRAVFPIAASIFMLLLIGNWIKLVPGFESVGLTVCAEYNVFAPDTDPEAPGQPGYRVGGLNAQGQPAGILTLFNSDNDGDGIFNLSERAGQKAVRANTLHCEEKYEWGKAPLAQAMEDRAIAEKRAAAEAKGEQWDAEKEAKARKEYHNKLMLKVLTAEEKAQLKTEEEKLEAAKKKIEAADPDLFTLVPFFRGVTTDLNLPIGLALVVVFMVQVWGVQALGGAYFFKFINLPALGKLSKKPLGAIDFLVGLIEIISELSRIVSLTFRLFGSVFAGGVLLIVFSFLIAVLLPVPIYFLELFVGGIQAYVFAILTIIYASQAVVHHGDEEHGKHAHGSGGHH
ncbi:MAG: F0F1 ATP synthase subunit A [Chloroflexi bacterium]|jgi:F0F1-type ATP synthase membrane subunit a|nr:F0F1 ATP synthase subunit A [Chloroflexota bacterium]